MKQLMRAVIYDKPGPPEILKIGECKKPVPSEKEILVQVKATSLNRADTLQRMGKYPPPKGASPILGLEISGLVVETGILVTQWKKGDKVFGLIPGGGYAEFAIINENMAMRIPEKFSYVQAASIPEVFLTAYQALIWYAKLEKGNSVLIHAGGSGVGTAAIQIARDKSTEIFITAAPSKHETCLKLGAKKAIDYNSQNFADEIMNFTNKSGVDIVIDFIAGPYFKKNVDCMKTDGRLIVLATLGGGRVDEFDLRKILTKRLSVIGSTLRSRSLDYQIKLTKEFSDFALPKFENGIFRPVIDSVFELEDVSEAHRYMEANKNIGKIVLEIN
jgi:putative PIG3 family NAD(P)H quinone oxidoreductase